MSLKIPPSGLEWFMAAAASLKLPAGKRGAGNLGHRGESWMWERTAEREVTRNRRALFIAPVKKHQFFFLLGKRPSGFTSGGSVPGGRPGMQKLGTPCFLTVLQQTDLKLFNLSQMWSITETGMSWERGWGGGGGGGGGTGYDPQQTGLMELEWEHKCWPRRGGEQKKKRSWRWRSRNAVQHSSGAAWQNPSGGLLSLWAVFRFVISINTGSDVRADNGMQSSRETVSAGLANFLASRRNWGRSFKIIIIKKKNLCVTFTVQKKDPSYFWLLHPPLFFFSSLCVFPSLCWLCSTCEESHAESRVVNVSFLDVTFLGCLSPSWQKRW